MKHGELNMGHGRALITIEDKELQKQIWSKIVKDKISVRDVEKLVKKKRKKQRNLKTIEDKPYYLLDAEEKLRMFLGTQVKIKPGKKGGSIEIDYYSTSDLERLLEILQ